LAYFPNTLSAPGVQCSSDTLKINANFYAKPKRSRSLKIFHHTLLSLGLMLLQVDLIAAELRKLGATPWLLDGFPRTRSQVSTFSEFTVSDSFLDPNPIDLALVNPGSRSNKIDKKL
jgi:hypothetical protein